jgi:TRAP-type uncharacterized transport system fused permease subunit
LAPALVRAGIGEMSAHLFILYFGLLSMLTPPVAIASYAAASLAGSDMWRTGLTGMQLAIVAYLIPFVFAFNPALLLDGTWPEIGVSCLSVFTAGMLLAEVLANRSAFGGSVARWGVGLLGLSIGASSAIFPPSSLPAIAIALVSIPAAYVLLRRRRGSSPSPISDQVKSL